MNDKNMAKYMGLAGAFLAGLAIGFMIAPIKKGVASGNRSFEFKDCEFHGGFDEDYFCEGDFEEDIDDIEEELDEPDELEDIIGDLTGE